VSRGLRAVLFDLDDTLLDYSSGADAAWAVSSRLAAGSGLDPDRLSATIDEVRRWFWSDPDRHARERVRMREAWLAIVTHALDRLGRAEAALATAIAEDFTRRRAAAWRLYDDAVPCLTALKARGIRLALVTNGDTTFQRDKIERFALASHFDVILIEGEFGVGKPDARVYAHVLDTLDVPPTHATMVGDNLEWDVLAPERYGITGIWLDRAGRGPAPDARAHPRRVVRTLDEILG